MSTHLLTPAMAGLLSRIQRAQRTPFHALSVADARRAYAVGAEVLDLPRVPLARIEDFSLPAADGTPLPARLYADTHQPVPALLYLHGGGFVIGGLETHDSLCRQLARRSGGAAAAQRRRGGGAGLPACARTPVPDRGRRHLGRHAHPGRAAR